MKRLQFNKSHNLSHLHDELLDAVPALGPVLNAKGEREAIIQVEGGDGIIWLTVPDNADEKAIKAVVDAHDPTRPTRHRQKN